MTDTQKRYNEVLSKQREYYNLLSENLKQYQDREIYTKALYGLTKEQYEELNNLREEANELSKELLKSGCLKSEILNGFKEVG